MRVTKRNFIKGVLTESIKMNGTTLSVNMAHICTIALTGELL